MADKPHIRAARRGADQAAARLSDLPASRLFFATVTQVSPLLVQWRGQPVAAKRGAAYTPVIGHRVLCALVENQPFVIDVAV